MPSNFSDVQITESDITITSGLYDTDDGIKLQVVGDDFPRIHITPQGEIKRGAGTDAPIGGPTVYERTFTQTDSSAVINVDDISGAYYTVGTFSAEGDVYVVFLVDDIAAVGSFTVVMQGITDGGVLAYVVSDGDGSNTAIIGPPPSAYPATGAVIHAVNAGNGWVMAPSSTRTTASSADYDNTESGLAATTVQGALDEIANLLP